MKQAVVLMAFAALAAGCTPKPAAAPAPGPAAAPASSTSKDTTIEVGPNGTYTINGQPTSAKDLQGALDEAARRDAAAAKAGAAK